MGSHVDTPEWQSFERRVRERSLARRRRFRLRWMVAIGGAILIGVNLKPPRVHRPSAPPASSSIESPKAAPYPQRASAVTVLRAPFAATVIAEQASAVPAIEAIETTGYAPPPEASQLSLPGAAAPEPETEPRPETGNEPAPEPKREPEPKPLDSARGRPETTTPEPRLEPPPRTPDPPRMDPPIDVPVPALAPAESRLPAAAPAPPPVIAATSVEQDVRKVIERYRDAYERLDAAAAHAVWPGVDQAALSRAFGGLTSQRIEFERCDIWRDAQAAFASCAGRASYVPKVGSAQNDVPRAWHFRFQRRPVGWTIESAEVR